MKVKQLIELLSKQDPELDVMVEWDMDGDNFLVKDEIREVRVDEKSDELTFDEDKCVVLCIALE